MPEINLPEIRRVLNHIESHLDMFRMQTWGRNWSAMMGEENFNQCNTQACFAGWCVLLNADPEERFKLFNVKDGKMDVTRTSQDAAEKFGFTPWESDYVFGTGVTLNDPQSQYEEVKRSINLVLERRGMTERV